MYRFSTKLELLNSATDETKELVAQAWEQGERQGRTKAPLFNFRGVKAMPAMPRARWWVQQFICLPFWLGYIATSPVWFPCQLCWFAWQSGWWAIDSGYGTYSEQRWFFWPDGGSANRFTQLLEETFPEE
jgi:hypothetical protein